MEVLMKNEWEHSEMNIVLEVPYNEDYQMRMLSNNRIEGLLEVKGSGIEGKSRYSYCLDTMVTMEKFFQGREIRKEDIDHFADRFISTVDCVKGYLLDPDYIVLSPDMVFLKDGEYFFTYLPASECGKTLSLCGQFHKITEYFVKNLDYNDTEGVHLICRLHRDTMGEQYDLKELIRQCREEEGKRKEKNKTEKEETVSRNLREISDGAIFSAFDEREEGENDLRSDNKSGMDIQRVGEQNIRYGPFQRIAERIKTGRWGEWRDLITEMDGHEGKGDL